MKIPVIAFGSVWEVDPGVGLVLALKCTSAVSYVKQVGPGPASTPFDDACDLVGHGRRTPGFFEIY